MRRSPKPSDDTQAFLLNLAATARGLRGREYFTQAQVSERSGLSTSLISRIERAKADPTVTQMGQLAEAFGLAGARELHVEVERVVGLGHENGAVAKTPKACAATFCPTVRCATRMYRFLS